MPFPVGAQGGGVDIEPFTSIMRHAPLVYYRMDEASGVLVNSGSTASRNITTATNLTYGQTKIATRSPKNAITFNGTTTVAETTAGVIGGVNPTFSIGCWIRTTDASGIDTLIAQRDGGQGFQFYIDSGEYLGFQGVATSGLNDFSMLSSPVRSINDNVNHYVSATVYSNTVILYCDGAEVGNFAGRSGGTWSATPKIFLGQTFGPTERYTGTMSDAFITSQVLTQTDHYRIWRNGMLHAATIANSNFLDAKTISVPVASTTISSFNFNNSTLELPLEPNTRAVGAPVLSYPKGIDGSKSAWFKFTSVNAGDRFRYATASVPGGISLCYVEIFKSTNGLITGLQKMTQYVAYDRLFNTLIIPEAATTYYIRMTQYLDFPSIFDFTYHYDTPPPPPANDNFANATTINTTIAGSIAGVLDGSTIEFPLETDNWTSEPNSVWYKFVADVTGNITFDTALSSPFNSMVLQAWENTTLAAIEASPYGAPWVDKNSGPGETVLVTVAVVSGRTYHIQASDFGTVGNFVMRWSDII